MSVKKQAISLLTGLAMLLTLLMLPVSVSAEYVVPDSPPTYLVVGGTIVVDGDSLNAGYYIQQSGSWKMTEDQPAEGTPYFHYAGGVLRLSDVTLNGNSNTNLGAGIFVEGGSLEIVTVGKNYINGATGDVLEPSIAVCAPGGAAVIFSGDGSLEINGADTSGPASIGLASPYISVTSGTVTVKSGQSDSNSGVNTDTLVVSGGVLAATGYNAGGQSFGISANELIVSGGTVNADISTNADGPCAHECFAVSASEITVSNGTLDAAGSKAKEASFGISVGKSLVISNNGKVTAISGEAGNASLGIDACGQWDNGVMTAPANIEVSGGTLDACGNKASNESYGIKTTGDFTVTGGKISAYGSEVTNTNEYPRSCGIATDGTMTVKNGTVAAIGGSSTHESYGVVASDILVSGGTVDATGAESTIASYGIATNGDLTVTGSGNVTATAGTAGNDSQAIDIRWNEQDSPGKLEVSGGTLTANGGQAGGASCGVKANGELIVSDGMLIANGGQATNGVSYGIEGLNMTVSGGVVDAKGQQAVSASSGIATNGNLTVTGNGNVTATAGDAQNESIGVNIRGERDVDGNLISSGKLEVSGGSLTGNGGQAELASFGIRTNNNIISGGTVTANGGQATGSENEPDSGDSYGLFADYLEVSGGKLQATGFDAENASFGIATDGNFVISGSGNVTALAGEGGDRSVGVDIRDCWTPAGDFEAYGVLSMSGGMLDTTGGNAGNESVGIRANGGETVIENGTLVARKGDAENGCGVIIPNVDLRGGTMIADTIGIDHILSSTQKGNALVYGQDSYLVGDVVLPVDIEIPEGVNVLITEGNSLTIADGVTLTNKGTISGDGTIYNNGKLENSESGNCTVEVIETVVPPVEEVEYTIWFNGNGGYVSVSSMTTTGGKLASLPYATRYGYTFTGWYTANGSLVSTGTTFTGDTTLYAGWRLNEVYVPVEPADPVTPEPEEPVGPEIEWVRKDGSCYLYIDDELITGWYENDDGWYWFDEQTGVMSEDCWEKIDGVWYLFDEDGIMLTGWQKVDGKWYYLKPWGGMATGWQLIDSVWYYLRGDGSMAANAWVQSGGYWYYLTGSGEMATNKWVEWKGDWYYLYSSGIMATNTTIDGCYIDSNGIWRA